MECFHPIDVRLKNSVHFVQVPCGKCLACKRRRQRDWVFRMKQESLKYPDQCFFITLTYSPEHVPKTTKGNFTLCKRDVQLFNKRLRKFLATYDVSYRYYFCGEYGDRFNRPHYHAILFFSNLYSYVQSTLSHEEIRTTINTIISRYWGLGFSRVDTFSDKSANYVAKYVVKKLSTKAYTQDDEELIPPFSLMSRKPGLGVDFVDTDMARLMVSARQFTYMDTQGNTYYLPRTLKEKMYNRVQIKRQSDIIQQKIDFQDMIDERNYKGSYTYVQFKRHILRNLEYQMNKLINNDSYIDFLKHIQDE